MISLTIFDSLYDNNTSKRLDLNSWKEFENMIFSLSNIERKTKKGAQLISPAIYVEGTDKRRNVNVESWGKWAAIDVDDSEFSSETIEEDLKKLYGKYQYICCSTASSKKEFPKFRIMFELTENVYSEDIRPFWHALNTELNSLGDKQCKDLSRMYYIPGKYEGAFNFFFSNEGEKISPKELIEKHPIVVSEKNAINFIDRLPEKTQKRVIKCRKEHFEAKNKNKFSWVGYQDCPFVNKKLINEYKSIAYIDGSGRYSMIYKIMTSIAAIAIKNKYPITESEIVSLVKELDKDTSNRYEKRPLTLEASRAIEYAYKRM